MRQSANIESHFAKRILAEPHWLGNFIGYDELQSIHSEMIKRVWYSKIDRYLQGFRGCFKTTAVTIVGTMARQLFRPNRRMLLTRKNYTKACKTIEEMGGKYRGDAMKIVYKRVWGIDDFKLVVDRKDRLVLPTKESITKEGNVDASGIDTKITGDHYEDQMNDDIIGPEDKRSKAEREKTIAYVNEQQNVRMPGGRIHTVGTPWHTQDAGTVLPAPFRYPWGHPGLNIPGITAKHVEEVKQSLTAAQFASNWLLKLIPDELRPFGEPIWGHWPEDVEPIAWLDPAYGGDDTTALVFIGVKDGQLYAVGFVWQDSVTVLYGRIVEKMRAWNAGTMWIDATGDKGLSAIAMREHWPVVRPYDEKENKHIKIMTYGTLNFEKVIWSYRTDPEFMDQMIDYQEGESLVDAPDAFASLCRQILARPAVTTEGVRGGGAGKGAAPGAGTGHKRITGRR